MSLRAWRENLSLLGVISHSSFWTEVSRQFLAGISVGIERLQDYNVSALYYRYGNATERESVMRQALNDGIGALVCVHFVPEKKEVGILRAGGIPFALLGTDGMEDSRLTCVRADSFMGGRLAAELMCLSLTSGKRWPHSPVEIAEKRESAFFFYRLRK